MEGRKTELYMELKVNIGDLMGFKGQNTEEKCSGITAVHTQGKECN